MARGRDAETPTEIPAKGWKDIAFRVKDEIASDHVSLIAAGVAFYALLALFPAITSLVAIAGLVLEPAQVVEQMRGLTGIMPQEVSDLIIGQATEVAGSREGGLGLAAVLGIALALYSASKGMASLIEGLNVAYDEDETRGFFALKLRTLALTLALILGVILAISLLALLPAALQFIDLGVVTEWIVMALGWILMFGVAVTGLAVLFRYGPSRDNPEWVWLSPGAVIGVLVWAVASAAFGLYVANFGSYNESFGSLAGAIVLLMWLWISAFIVLFAAELNAEMEAQTRYDTTVGEDRPMGERGAEKADRLGESKG
jgi:membrane protein